MLPLVSIITTVVIGTGLFSKTLMVTGLHVVEDLEVLEHEIGDETLLGVGDGHVDGDRVGGDLDRLLLGGGRGRQRQDDGATSAAAIRRMGLPEMNSGAGGSFHYTS